MRIAETDALLLLDYQRALCAPDGKLGAVSGLAEHATERGVLRKAQTALASAREARMLVVHVRVVLDAASGIFTNRTERFYQLASSGALGPDASGAEFCSEVAPQQGEIVIEKGCVNPFIGTPLQELLTAHGARRLFLGGVATNFVVESSARHACDSGFDVVVIEDLCAAYNDEMHNFSIERLMPAFGKIIATADFVASCKRVQ